MWCVKIVEYERNCGPRVHELREFGPDRVDKDAAEEFVKEFNKNLGKGEVPEIYWKALQPHWRDDV